MFSVSFSTWLSFFLFLFLLSISHILYLSFFISIFISSLLPSFLCYFINHRSISVYSILVRFLYSNCQSNLDSHNPLTIIRGKVRCGYGTIFFLVNHEFHGWFFWHISGIASAHCELFTHHIPPSLSLSLHSLIYTRFQTPDHIVRASQLLKFS